MAGQTDNDFEQALMEDFGWRRVELVHLKRLLNEASRSSADSPATRGLSRAMIAMCYAHWEGYAKNNLERYAKLVTRRKPRVSEAGDGLVVEHVSRLLRRMSSGDAQAKVDLLDAIRGSADARVNVDRSALSDTTANLRFAVLKDLFVRGCIPVATFELKANLIDVLLCDRRNGVAHGRALFVDAPDSMSLCDEVLELMEDLRDVLVSQVRSRSYLSASLPARIQDKS